MVSKKKSESLRLQDPALEREKARYGHALPSRDFILDILKREGIPVQPARLAELLGIEASEDEIFERRLMAMERDGQIMRNRKGALCIAEKLHLVAGRVEAHPDGYGFLVRDDGGPDMFLSSRQMDRVLHGDRVMARQSGLDRRGRPEGAIVEVLERANRSLVGRIHVDSGVTFFVAEDRRVSQDILVPPGEDGGAKPGQVVVLEITGQPSEHAQALGRVTEVLGNYADPGMEIEIALRKHDLPHVFSREVEAVCEELPRRVLKRDLEGREDLRDLPLVTIDGETAKDFDDAVYCVRQGRGFRLVVAIADVSHYVRPGDPLDREARDRGNSIYFPRRVIPMLPEVLSNGLCSLNPEVDRLCMVCDMDVGPRGDIGRYRFYPAAMHSRARLTYTAVAEMLADPQSASAAKHAALLPHIRDLEAVFRALVQARGRRGAIDFETIETELIFDRNGKIENIVAVQRNDAHRLIEECMLAANVCASDLLQERGHPALYRVHEGPTPAKLEALRDFLSGFGLQLGGGEEPQAKDYAKLLEKVRVRPDAQLLQTVMLRSLKQAQYSPENVGHFGLAYEHYTHFTSPIRRYPDLLVHRAIKAVMEGGSYSPGDWLQLGAHCSQTERRADEATRDVVNWLKCYYMQDRVGEVFDGTISAVTGFGVFVALDAVFVEGLVHISELGSDYFEFDPVGHQLLGERTRKRFRLSDRMRVRLVRVDLEQGRIDFVPADAQ